MNNMYLNGTGSTDILAREMALRFKLISGDDGMDPALVQPHVLRSNVQLKNGTNSYTFNFGVDGNRGVGVQQLLQNNDAFFAVGASLRVGKAPVLGGAVQWGMTTYVTYPSPLLFNKAAANAGDIDEKSCIRSIFSGGILDFKAGSEEIIFEMLAEFLMHTPEVQEDPANGFVAGTGAINDLERFRLLSKNFGYIGQQRNEVTLKIQDAETTELEGDTATGVNVVSLELFGHIVRGGADPVLTNSGKSGAKYVCA